MPRTKLIRNGKLVNSPLADQESNIDQLGVGQKSVLSDLVFKAKSGGALQQKDLQAIMNIRADAKVAPGDGMRKLQTALNNYKNAMAGKCS